MNKRIHSGVLSAFIIAIAPLITIEVSVAGGIDGSSDTVCAVMYVVACVEDKKCVNGSAKSFDLPEFVIFDEKKKVIKSAYETGHKAVSPIKNLEINGGHLIMQGVENGRGWNIAINSKTGNMSGAAVGDAVSFLIFGSCTTL